MLGKGVANALAFARFIMVATIKDYHEGYEFDSKVIKLIAIDIITLVCLLYYFSTRFGILLNKVFALYKLCLLVAVIVAGGWAVSQQNIGLNREAQQPSSDPVSQLSAFVLVLYSYTGWENANYVCRCLKSAR